MSQSFVGMEIEAVRTLARQFGQKANEIEQIQSQLTTQLGSTQWVGNDAARFREEWQSRHSQSLRQVISALQGAEQDALRNVSEQESASN